jgi:hypothetical protein
MGFPLLIVTSTRTLQLPISTAQKVRELRIEFESVFKSNLYELIFSILIRIESNLAKVRFDSIRFVRSRTEGQLLPEIDGSEAETQEGSEASDEESQTTPEATASVLETQVTYTPTYTPTSRDILVARTIKELRENHECGHDRWKYVRGPHRCEECSH